jgi:hypothetical protein
MLGGSLRSASHPLTRAVLDRIVRDEAPHGQLGWMYLEWADDEMTDAERARLGRAAVLALEQFAPLYQRLRSKALGGVTSEGFRLDDVRALGWMESTEYGALARDAVAMNVVRPLARHGIIVPESDVERLIA